MPGRRIRRNFMQTIDSFKEGLKVEDSIRASVLMLIGLYGGSGSGKTVTALIWARGMAGPDAVIGAIDTEQKRLTIAADIADELAAKHYGRPVPKTRVVHLDAPYHPLRYVAAGALLLKAGCQAIVVDSMSHSWNGEGGYLDLKEEALNRMAGNDWKKRETCAMAAAAQTKPHTHSRLFNFMTHLPVPTILCFRAVEKTRIGKSSDNRTEIKRDDFTSPIHDNLLIYEMLVSGECSQSEGIGGYVSFRGPGRKTTHPEIMGLLPKEDEQFGFKHAEALAAWCAGKSPVATTKAPAVESPTKKLEIELWQLLKPIRKPGEKDWGKSGANEWLWREGILDPATEPPQTAPHLTAEQFKKTIAATKERLAE